MPRLRTSLGIVVLASLVLAAASCEEDVAMVEDPLQSAQPDFVLAWGDSGGGPGQLSGPVAVATDRFGDVIVADRGNSRVVKFAGDGTLLWTVPDSSALRGSTWDPVDVACDSVGTVYVADALDGEVVRVSRTGFAVDAWSVTAGPQDTLLALTVDDAGSVHLVLADSAGFRYERRTLIGDSVLAGRFEVGAAYGQLRSPSDVEVGPSGRVYVTDDVNHRIVVFSPSVMVVQGWGEEGTAVRKFLGPSGLAFDSYTAVYVADRDNHRMQKWDRDGNYIAFWGAEGTGAGSFRRPVDVAVGPGDEIYVLDAGNHRVQRFAP
jgi:DNA-binding beta-propeller fold protein YncE